MATNPTDYLSGLGGLQNIPDPLRDMQIGQARKMGLQAQALQNQAAQIEIANAQRQQERQQLFDADIVRAGIDAASTADLIRRYPEYAKELSTAWDMKDKAAQRADLRSASEIYAAARGGNWQLAAKQLQRRIDADKAAGLDTLDDEEALAAFNSGEPEQQQRALGMLAFSLASSVGPTQFAEAYNAVNKGSEGFTLAPGSKRFDANGALIAEAPFAPELRSVGAGDTLVEVQPGGVTGTRAARNNNPGNLRDGAFAKGLPGYQGSDAQGFAIFDSPTNGANATTSLLRSYGQRGFDTPAKIIARWAPPSDGNDTVGYARTVAQALGIGVNDKIDLSNPATLQTIAQTISRVEGGGSSGGARVVAQGAAKPGYTLLSTKEKSALGLPVGIAFQRSPDGQVAAISGQDTRTQQAQAVPAAAQKSIIDNHSTLREIDRAIALVRARPESFGYFNSWTPDAVLQRTDSKGNAARAAVGKIGGKIIHDVSGAAVTMSEAPRFQPYVPVASDTAEQILNKLQQMRDLAAADQADLQTAYGPENGYRGVKLPGQSAPVRVSSVAQANALKPGALYIRPDGKVMRR